ncbi:MAG: dihydroorotate dehydrogenase-like protein [Prolixibacteraceae bacterium]
MADLSTTYMGLTLKNPIILGASNLVNKPEVIEQLEANGIAAIVYKSLFEEQIQLESIQLDEELHEYEERNAEMTRIFPDLEHAGPKEHLLNVKTLKKRVKIPVIGSLNALYEPTWVDYARELEQAGIDALEINLYAVPGYFETEGSKIEELQVETVHRVKNAVKIPVSVKLSPFYTNTLNFIKKLDEAGADGFVLFNRFFQPDINIQEELFYFPWDLSQEKDYQLSLRYAGLLYKNTDAGICSSRGIFNADDIIKLLLAGTDTVQVVSAIYKNHPTWVAATLNNINDWMTTKGYRTLADFRGKLSRKNLKDPYSYQRAQYVDLLSKPEEVFKKYPMV